MKIWLARIRQGYTQAGSAKWRQYYRGAHVNGELLRQEYTGLWGGYLRHFPFIYTRWALRRTLPMRSAILYMHPYDMDTRDPLPDFAEMIANAPRRSRIRYALQLRNRNTMPSKIRKLLTRYQFGPIRQVITEQSVQVGGI